MAHHEKGFFRIQIPINDNLGISVLRLRNIRNNLKARIEGMSHLGQTYISLDSFCSLGLWSGFHRFDAHASLKR